MNKFFEIIGVILVIDFTSFGVFLLVYKLYTAKLIAMTDCIKKDGNLNNFKNSLVNYYSLTWLSDLIVFSIPEDEKFQQFESYNNLVTQTKKVRTILKWTGIPIIMLFIVEFIFIIYTTSQSS